MQYLFWMQYSKRFLNEKGRLFYAFVDMKKGFDSIYLNGLGFKLFKLGMNRKMIKIIKDIYNKVKVCIKGCNSYSDFFNCAVGFKQGGGNFANTIFILYWRFRAFLTRWPCIWFVTSGYNIYTHAFRRWHGYSWKEC